MKRVASIVIALLWAFGAGYEVGTWHAGEKVSVAPSKTPLAKNHPPPNPFDSNQMTTPAEWQDYHATREKTLHNNPELAAEYQGILSESNKHQEEIEAAMVKVDPKMAPIVAKLALIRERNRSANSATTK